MARTPSQSNLTRSFGTNKSSLDLNTFRTEITGPRGIARTNRFEIRFNPPAGHSAGMNMNRTLSMRVETINLPGVNLSTSADASLYGPSRDVVDGVLYAETLAMTMIMDGMFNLKRFWEEWQHLAVSPTTWDIHYYDEYTSTIDIYVLDAEYKPVHGVRLWEAFPKTIGAIAMTNVEDNAIVKLPVDLEFRYWTDIDLWGTKQPWEKIFPDTNQTVVGDMQSGGRGGGVSRTGFVSNGNTVAGGRGTATGRTGFVSNGNTVAGGRGTATGRTGFVSNGGGSVAGGRGTPRTFVPNTNSSSHYASGKQVPIGGGVKTFPVPSGERILGRSLMGPSTNSPKPPVKGSLTPLETARMAGNTDKWSALLRGVKTRAAEHTAATRRHHPPGASGPRGRPPAPDVTRFVLSKSQTNMKPPGLGNATAGRTFDHTLTFQFAGENIKHVNQGGNWTRKITQYRPNGNIGTLRPRGPYVILPGGPGNQ